MPYSRIPDKPRHRCVPEIDSRRPDATRVRNRRLMHVFSPQIGTDDFPSGDGPRRPIPCEELASQLSICGNGDPTGVDRNEPSVL